MCIRDSGQARVWLRIEDFDGHRLKRLAAWAPVDGSRSWTWKGRTDTGRKVAYGPYRVQATITSGTVTYKRSAWITRSKRVPYATRPGAITVALDPGHGGPAAGAVWRGWAEDRVNLDVGLRLQAMLVGAGIDVVMTRRGDHNVSPTGRDLNRDGKYTRVDELIARNDVANQARADIHLALHNNASACHCQRGTEMYTHFGRSWTPEGRKLARALLKEHLWHLGRVPGYGPRDRGVRTHGFKALKPYHRVKMPRPSLQPSVLGESLFLDWPSEHRLLATRSGRQVVAAAYFDGIARYLAQRPYGLRYEVLEAPRVTATGSQAAVTVRLTNTGHRTSAGWKLVARVVGKVPRYDGRPRRGEVVRKVAVPDGLAPGGSTTVTLAGIPMRGTVGSWLLKLDVNLPGGDSLSRHGVVGPQLRLDTVAP
jgi:N-acetylmuramoyl-L-alanine amidase